MLNLLKQLQSVTLPLLRSVCNNEDTPLCFPFTSIFDAVTPYYPIKFTPPPTDPWGITKQGLHGSLMDVLTYSTHHVSNKSMRTGLDVDNNMTLLVTNLFLERLHIEEYPYDDNTDSTTTQDRIDAIQDLFELLLPSFEHDQSSPTEKQMYISLLLLPNEAIYEMSNIIRRCHEDAAISVISSTDIEDKKNFKRLADLCRNFANRFAFEVEVLLPIQNQYHIPQKTSWESFVHCTTKELDDVIASSPQSVKGRVAIAYVASLSACGGEKTLRLCLETYMPVLLRLLKNCETLNNDEEQMSIAANGISAFFSSCKVSMEQISKDKIVIYPHPLHAYASEVIDLLCKVIVKEESSDQLKGAAIKALESVLVSCPHEIMTVENIDSVKKTILNIAQCLNDYLNTSFNRNEPSEDWKSACSRILGTSIGRSIRNKQYDPDSQAVNTILFEYDNEISEFVSSSLLPKILLTCTQRIHTADKKRLDWKVLAYACEIGERLVSEWILVHMFEALTVTIQSKSQDEQHLESITLGLSFILKHGGNEAISAFHDQGLQLKLIDVLSCAPCTNQDVGISNLVLPEVRRKTQADAEKVVSR